MMPVLEFRRQRAVLIFEVEDRFVRELGLAGPHPHATGPFQFFAVAQVVAGQRRPLITPWNSKSFRNAGGFHLFFGKTKPQSAAGSKPPGDPVIRGALVPGTYIIRSPLRSIRRPRLKLTSIRCFLLAVRARG